MKAKTVKKMICVLSGAIVLAEFFAGPAAALEFVVDRFSSETGANGMPKGWERLIFQKIPNHTRYTVIREGDNFYLKAASSNSSSGILKRIELDPKAYSILRWRWKIDHALEKADATRKDGDDYPARIYVAFKYDPGRASIWERAKYGTARKLYGQYPPKCALNYVWDNKLPVGTSLNNAYTDRAKMIVMESGKEKAGQWVSEERDIYEDYKKLFGAEPPEIAFIAVMSDTDNTGESATACFDDIVLESR